MKIMKKIDGMSYDAQNYYCAFESFVLGVLAYYLIFVVIIPNLS